MQTPSLYSHCNNPTAITLLGQTTQSLHRVSEGTEGLTVTGALLDTCVKAVTSECSRHTRIFFTEQLSRNLYVFIK